MQMMKPFEASDGQLVTDEMISRWAAALDKDEWPKGEHSIGEVIIGRPPMSPEGSAVLSVKVPTAMKRAIEGAASAEGISTSDFVRKALVNELLSASA
jgi:hypothetical protein